MPFHLPFFYTNGFYPPHISQKIYNNEKKDSENIESSESFFEILGLKLYFDDILIICILLFLYNEEVHNDELFICLILLLFT